MTRPSDTADSTPTGPGARAPGADLAGFHPSAFTRADTSDDADFYAARPLRAPETLMDGGAAAAVTALYKTLLPEDGVVLDLMAGEDSHFPKDTPFERVLGVGLNLVALNANDRIDEAVAHDLNADPGLPFADHAFDAACLCDGIAYLTQPVAVLRDVARVLKPGAPLVVTFTDRFEPRKAVAMWQALEGPDRQRLVGILMERAGLTALDTGEVTPPEDLPAWQDTVYAVIGHAPLV
ncbi:hypothetical protein AA103196_0328 [Ameyamaea chiangmaiensis NBRC 103196]|uniref:Methyltransferase domain-containing protein n=1 Tax=Ameyamaea chiangmaiensis TaxID=442969 RepID=A0A850PE64_9PROT|nr:methyltransferase domain-containing protein [Ameyamaea chiangmaiensis]MBS4074725.1 methyltransferase domain-containing protein [Ameyamaea chiangmaiensis]NVN40232.1 methyltransferase domain-containing protein [Ameyamaea chiangmaiensis]GBQ62507.1 hypothetical protein AA103196_0328 [Ameyamaea chiangmaiensis NBRC 103196]